MTDLIRTILTHPLFLVIWGLTMAASVGVLIRNLTTTIESMPACPL